MRFARFDRRYLTNNTILTLILLLKKAEKESLPAIILWVSYLRIKLPRYHPNCELFVHIRDREHAQEIILDNEPSNPNHVGWEWLFSISRIFCYSSSVLLVSSETNDSA